MGNELGSRIIMEALGRRREKKRRERRERGECCRRSKNKVFGKQRGVHTDVHKE
jgi:hypothetical protein